MKLLDKNVFLLFFLITNVFSSPYEVFVSPGGNDSNSGTEALPLKTLNCARDKAVKNKTSLLFPAVSVWHDFLPERKFAGF